MRYVIWKKDDYFEIIDKGRFDMDVSVVKLPEEPIPLVWDYHHDMIIGRVNDIRLEDGEITGEVEFSVEKGLDDDFLEENELRLGGYYTNVTQDQGRVVASELRGVSVVFKSRVPGAT